MKRILFIVLMLWGVAYGQVCADEDTVRSNTATMITYNSARINGTTAHFSGAVTSIQLKYVRVGQTDTVTSSGVAALRNITGLQASTQYYYYYKTICGSGSVSQTIGAYTFTTAANTILYADERPTRFHYAYIDSLLQIGAVDTSLYRAPTHPSIVYKSSDDTYYGYHLDCSCWQPLAIDSSGIIALLDNKVDSVTVSGDSLFYWKVGVSYGYLLPSLATVWHTDGNAGIDTSTDFIGTTDNVDFPIKTNDVRRFTVNTSGALGIGATPDYGTSGYLFQSGGSGASPAWTNYTLQKAITAGSTLTAQDTIDMAGYDLFFNTNGGQVNFASDDPGNVVFHCHVFGEAAERLQVQADGHLEWGDGAGTIDVGISRIKDGTLLLGGAVNNSELYFLTGTNDTSLVSFGEDATGTRNGYLYYKNVGNEMGIYTPGNFYLHNISNAVGTKALRYNPTTGLVSYADTTAGGGLTVGTTTITSGTDTKVLYNNAGTLGEYTVSGTGNVAMTTSPTFTTPALGTPSALVGTNITGTGTGFTAGAVNNSLSIGAELIAGGATTYNGSAAKTLGIQATSVTNAMLAGSIAASKLVGTDITTVGTISTGIWQGNAVERELNIYAALGSTIKGETVFGTASGISSGTGLTDNRIYFIACYLPKATTLTGVKFYQHIQGSYTADNYNGVGLYTYSGGTLTLVASSTDDGNIWKTANATWSSKAFSSTYVASAGLYFVAFVYNSSAQTTAPSLGYSNALTNGAASVDFTNSAKVAAYVAGNTLPATQAMSGTTIWTIPFYMGLY